MHINLSKLLPGPNDSVVRGTYILYLLKTVLYFDPYATEMTVSLSITIDVPHFKVLLHLILVARNAGNPIIATFQGETRVEPSPNFPNCNIVDTCGTSLFHVAVRPSSIAVIVVEKYFACAAMSM